MARKKPTKTTTSGKPKSKPSAAAKGKVKVKTQSKSKPGLAHTIKKWYGLLRDATKVYKGLSQQDLPDFENENEIPPEYVSRLVTTGYLESYRTSGESDDDLIKRLLAEDEFMFRVDNKVNEFIRKWKIENIRKRSK